MIELLNAAACLVLLALLMRVSLRVHRWRHKAAVIAVALVFGMQVVDPVARWLPAVLWTTVAVNVTLAVLATVWRRELWALLRCKLGLDELPPDCTACPMRRSSDFAALDDAHVGAQPHTSYGGTS